MVAKLVTHSREEASAIIVRLNEVGCIPKAKWWFDGETEIIAPSESLEKVGYNQ